MTNFLGVMIGGDRVFLHLATLAFSLVVGGYVYALLGCYLIFD